MTTAARPVTLSVGFISLWQRILRAVVHSRIEFAALDANARLALGNIGDDLLNQMVVLSASEEQPLAYPFRSDPAKRADWFRQVSASDTHRDALVYGAAKFVDEVISAGLVLPGFRRLLRFAAEWLYAQCLGCIKLRTCTQGMIEGQRGFDSIHRERERFLLALAWTTDPVTGAYSPFSFDRIKKKTRSAPPAAGAPRPPPDPVRAQEKQDIARRNALALFFDLDIEIIGKDKKTKTIRGKRSSSDATKPIAAHYEDFARLLEAQNDPSRNRLAALLRAFVKDPDNQAEVKSIYWNEPESPYAVWKDKRGEGDEILSLYREWVLRQAGYVVAGDPRPDALSKPAKGSSACDLGHVTTVFSALADELQLTQDRLARFIAGRTMPTSSGAVTTTKAEPQISLRESLDRLEYATQEAIHGGVLRADHAYAEHVCAGMHLSTPDSRGALAEWFVHRKLPRLWQEFVLDYYERIEKLLAGNRNLSVNAYLRSLENTYYRKVLQAVMRQVQERLDKFQPDAANGVGKMLSEALPAESAARPVYEWYRDNNPIEPEWDLAEGAYSLGSTSGLLAELLENCVRAPVVVLGIKLDKPVPGQESIDATEPVVPNKVSVASLQTWNRRVISPALASLGEKIDAAVEGLRNKKATVAKQAGTEPALRRAVLIVRNYLLSELVDPAGRAYLIDVLDNLYAEHLADQYSPIENSAPVPLEDEATRRLWLEPMTPSERSFSVTLPQSNVAISREDRDKWFHRPSAKDYASNKSFSLRQAVLGTQADWQSLEPPAKAFEREVDKLAAMAIDKVNAEIAESNRQLEAMLRKESLRGDDTEMEELSGDLYEDILAAFGRDTGDVSSSMDVEPTPLRSDAPGVVTESD